MALYSRLIPHQKRAADQIHSMILRYPDGVTVRTLMKDNSEFLKDPNSVLAAIDLLVKEGKIREERSTGHEHHLDSVKVFPI